MGLLGRVPWRLLVVDEAHRLKNPEARLFQQLQGLRADHCVLLTGTPLQNRTEELWSLLHFASPTQFPRLADFVDKFGDLRDSSQVGFQPPPSTPAHAFRCTCLRDGPHMAHQAPLLRHLPPSPHFVRAFFPL